MMPSLLAPRCMPAGRRAVGPACYRRSTRTTGISRLIWAVRTSVSKQRTTRNRSARRHGARRRTLRPRTQLPCTRRAYTADSSGRERRIVSIDTSSYTEGHEENRYGQAWSDTGIVCDDDSSGVYRVLLYSASTLQESEADRTAWISEQLVEAEERIETNENFEYHLIAQDWPPAEEGCR